MVNAILVVLAVIQYEGKYCLIQEKSFGQTWYLPAGRVNSDESFEAAAVREVKEEAGLDIELTGLIRIEQLPDSKAHYIRVFYSDRPAGEVNLKSRPDDHSLQARWVTLDEMDKLVLRDEEARSACRYIETGQPVKPLSTLVQEGTSWPVKKT